ncbi:MAG: ATP-binding protein [Elusimicrobia bacterium]|nr:ATP-binding protein [Elusimicrobiota bacterium]
MVIVGGPRQVGKTTLAKSLLKNTQGYLNWDIPEHREKILRYQLPRAPLWVFDEIHKYRSWRNYLKGLYDKNGPGQKMLVTGSARLDFYRFGGDSLQGRYHYLRFHPLSVAELKITNRKDFDALLTLGGFPEPFFKGSPEAAKRWAREYRNRLIREDITALEGIQDLGNLELLILRLPELVGSPLSLNALREDLLVSHKTMAHWIMALERLYAVFRIAPFGPPKVRAIKKEQKHYHFDWSLVPDLAARFENMVAAHLLKTIHFKEDAKGKDMELRYFRTPDGREVDFVVLEDRKPIQLVECKWSDSEISKNLRYLKVKFPEAEAWQLSAAGKKDYVSPDGIRVVHALEFLKSLI